jgi:hypothetical protein
LVVGALLLRLNLAQMRWLGTPVAQAGFRCDVKALLSSAPFDRLGGWAFVEQMAQYYGEQGPPLEFGAGETATKVGVYCPFGYLERVSDALMPSLKLHGGGPGTYGVVYEFGGEGLKGFTKFETATVTPYPRDFTIVCESAVHSPTNRRVQRVEYADPEGSAFSVRFVHAKFPEKPLLAGTHDRVALPTCRIKTRFGDVMVLEAKAELRGSPGAVLGVRGDGVLTRADQEDGRAMTVGAWLRQGYSERLGSSVSSQSDRSRSSLRTERWRMPGNWIGAGVVCALLGTALWLGRRGRGERGATEATARS